MLEELKEVQEAIKKGKPKNEVEDKFKTYLEAYDNMDKNLDDKINHREIFYSYMRYMEKR